MSWRRIRSQPVLIVKCRNAIEVTFDTNEYSMKLFRFSADQLEQFRTQGYTAVPDFWNADEVRAMQLELERLKANGLLRNVATDGDGKTTSQTKANLQLCPMSP